MFDEFKKKGIEKMVAVKFTLTSNDSEGVVTYASSPGIEPLLESLLWYFSSEMKGPNTQRTFASLDITVGDPDPSKHTPVTSYYLVIDVLEGLLLSLPNGGLETTDSYLT